MKNKSLTFITGNSGKLAEVQAFLPFVVGKNIDLPEIQEIDLQNIVEEKLRSAVALHNGSVMVDDTALYLDCFASKNGEHGLPGPLIKWFLKTVTNSGLAAVAQKLENKKATARTIIGYCENKKDFHFFEGVVDGSVIPPQGTSGFGWDHIFVPEGYTKTFAKMGEKKNEVSPRSLAVNQLKNFLKQV